MVEVVALLVVLVLLISFDEIVVKSQFSPSTKPFAPRPKEGAGGR